MEAEVRPSHLRIRPPRCHSSPALFRSHTALTGSVPLSVHHPSVKHVASAAICTSLHQELELAAAQLPGFKMRANVVLSAMMAALAAPSLAFTARPGGAQRGSNIELRAALATTASPTISPQVGAGVDFELPINSLTLECRNPQPPQDMKKLANDGFVVIDNFIAENLVEELRNDVLTLRQNNAFRQAKIGQGRFSLLMLCPLNFCSSFNLSLFS